MIWKFVRGSQSVGEGVKLGRLIYYLGDYFAEFRQKEGSTITPRPSPVVFVTVFRQFTCHGIVFDGFLDDAVNCVVKDYAVSSLVEFEFNVNGLILKGTLET